MATQQSPSFYFRLRGIEPDPRVRPREEGATGSWLPHRTGGNIESYFLNPVSGVPIHGVLFQFDGQNLHLASNTDVESLESFRVRSAYYCTTRGVLAIEGDAIARRSAEYAANEENRVSIADDMDWSSLGFRHTSQAVSLPGHGLVNYPMSLLELGGEHNQIRVQHSSQRWVHQIVPIPHQASRASGDQWGIMNGDLALMLALLAFSSPPELVLYALQHSITSGGWRFLPYHTPPYPIAEVRRLWDRRGLVVEVYCRGSENRQQLSRYECGQYHPLFFQNWD